MRIGVVGARGFLGSQVASHLAAGGYDLLPITRDSGAPSALDVLIDCNGDARRFWAQENPGASFAANVETVRDRLSDLTFGLYLYCSTVDVYGAATASPAANRESSPLDPATMPTYGLHKFLAECLVRHHAADHLILRLGTLIGPGLKKNPIFDAAHGAPIRQTPDSTISLLHTDYAVRAMERLIEKGLTGVYNVTSSEAIAVADMVAMVDAATGRKAEYIRPAEQIHTSYDISIGKISEHLELTSSAEMLEGFLENSI